MLSAPRQKILRFLIILAGIVIPHAILYGPSMIGQKVLLPLDLLRMPQTYLPPKDSDKSQIDNWIMADQIDQFEPYRHYATEQVRSGHLPLWNPLCICGAPFMAANQPAIFSLYRLLDYLWPDPRSIVWNLLLRNCVAGFGAYFFFRRSLRVRFWPSVFGAWCFPLTGFLTLWGMYPTGWAVTWFPFLLWSTEATIRGPKSKAWMALAIITGLALVAGHSATTEQMLILDGLFALWEIHRRYGRWALVEGDGFLPLGALAAGWIVGILLSLPQTLPTAEYMRMSMRLGDRSNGLVESPPVGLPVLPQMVLPYFFGDGRAGSTFLIDGTRLSGMAAAYAGLIATLIIAPLAWTSRSRRRRLLFWFFAAVFGCGQILDVPFLRIVYTLPVMDLLQNVRLTFITGFAVVAWMVVGLDQFSHRRFHPRAWMILLGLIPLYLAFISFRLHLHPPSVTPEWFARAYLVGAVWCIAAIAALVLIYFCPRQAVGLLGIVCVVELTCRAKDVIVQSDPSIYYPNISVLAAVEKMPPGRICGVHYLPADMNMMHDLPDLAGYDAVDPWPIVQLLLKVRNPVTQIDSARTQWYFPQLRIDGNQPALDLLDLRYLLFCGNPPAGLTPIWSDGNFSIVERPTATTRVFVPHHVDYISDSDAQLDELASPNFNPRESLILESVPAIGDQMDGEAQMTLDQPSHVAIKANMKTPGFVLLADQWDSGWRAYVDGVQQPIWRADHAFRAVQVPAGKSTVDFRYQPLSFTMGLWGMCLGGIALVLAGLFQRPQSKSHAPAPTSL